MALSPITADSLRGRILLALRAGTTEKDAIYERFTSFATVIGGLEHAYLVERGAYSYRLTDAGRAACPFRNPKAAPPGASAITKEIQPMPATAGLTTTKVLDRIIAAGPAGTSANALADEFGVSNKGIYYHIKGMGAAVCKTRGRVVAAGFVKPGIPAEIAAEAEKIAREYAEMIDFEIEPAAEAPAKRAAGGFVPALRESAAAENAKPGAWHLRVAPDCLCIDDPDQVEMAVFSSGGMDIYFDDNTITLSAPVLAKLRAYLGVSQRGR